MPFTTVDPRDPDTVGYDPCSGDAAAIANKIVGAFTFSGEAEIYKQVAMEVIPVICRALQPSGEPMTLDSIYDALNKGGMSRLGRRDGAEAVPRPARGAGATPAGSAPPGTPDSSAASAPSWRAPSASCSGAGPPSTGRSSSPRPTSPTSR